MGEDCFVSLREVISLENLTRPLRARAFRCRGRKLMTVLLEDGNVETNKPGLGSPEPEAFRRRLITPVLDCEALRQW